MINPLRLVLYFSSHSTFVWEGLDGSRVLAHMPPADTYNAQAFPEEVLRSATKNKDASVLNQAVMLVGHGDGGGGASPAMMESIRRMRDVDGVPKVEFSTPERFFAEVKKQEDNLPRWVGELYFELHRGTFTSQAVTKKSNRLCENMLRDLEAISAQALIIGTSVGASFPYPSDLLKQCWKLVLKNCFHDTLPGSCIGEVYKETARDYKFVMDKCTEAIDAAVVFISRCLTTGVNSAVQPSKRMKVENGSVAPEGFSDGTHGTGKEHLLVVRNAALREKSARPYILEVGQASLSTGSNIYSQPGKIGAMTCIPDVESSVDDQERLVVALKDRPSGIGFVSSVDMVSTADVKHAVSPVRITAREAEHGTDYILSNGLVEARVSSTGQLKSLVLLSKSGHRREALSQEPDADGSISSGGNRLVVYDDVSQFWCAWDTEVYCFEKKAEVGGASSCDIVEDGPLRVGLHLKYPPTQAGSVVEQFITLRAESARVDFRTTVDWKESRKILRVLFNTQVRASQASYDSQFGFIQRPTTFNNSWETAKFESVGHHYCDISEHGFGVALLNDCKYGYSVRDSMMRLSLLRAPKSPDDQADMGVHTMTYGILPHWEAFPTKTVLEEGADLNWPPLLHKVAIHGTEGEELQGLECLFQVLSHPGKDWLDTVVISALKEADKQPGHLVLRLYEAMGARGTARIKCPHSMQVKSVRECNMLEDVKERATGVSLYHDAITDDTELHLAFSPFQIRTVVLQFQ